MPQSFKRGSRKILRTDFWVEIPNSDNNIHCHLYHFENESIKNVIIYCHSFSENALSGKFLLETFSKNFSILLYDHRGCGNNMEEFITLGLRESLDLNRIIDYLTYRYDFPGVYLWGRSMGAVCVIHFLHRIESEIIY